MGAEYAGTAGRLILGGFFLVAGIVNLVTPGSIRDHIDRMRAYGTPAPAVAFWGGIGVQFLGAALVLSGVRADLGAVCLIVFTALATAIFHRFWQRTDRLQQRTSKLFFMSNAAIIGGLLLLASGAARAQPTEPVRVVDVRCCVRLLLDQPCGRNAGEPAHAGGAHQAGAGKIAPVRRPG